ncbi:MAG: heavy metal-responsive transcriptional regulator [Actinomycetota bacterium]|nr:heavy metal-responsive transcriptional regulator [Actinomycetota bacterium]
MRIGQLGDRLGVNPKTIRYYEDIGLLPAPGRTPAGYRIYGDDAIERLTFIKTAQRLGITLDEVREILGLRDRGEPPCGYVREMLRRQVGDIDQRIAELGELRDQLLALEKIADRLPEPGPGQCRIIDHARKEAER